MAPDATLFTEVVRQVPSIGAALTVGWVFFRAYRHLVSQMMVVIEASTKAITANTEVMRSLSSMIDALPGKVVHDLRNAEHLRGLRAASRGEV